MRADLLHCAMDGALPLPSGWVAAPFSCWAAAPFSGWAAALFSGGAAAVAGFSSAGPAGLHAHAGEAPAIDNARTRGNSFIVISFSEVATRVSCNRRQQRARQDAEPEKT